MLEAAVSSYICMLQKLGSGAAPSIRFRVECQTTVQSKQHMPGTGKLPYAGMPVLQDRGDGLWLNKWCTRKLVLF